MIGRMIPASTVIEHLQAAIDIAAEAGEGETLQVLVAAAEEMSLVEVNARDEAGNATDITWLIVQ